jgi:predicted transcriptional regulator
MKTDVKKSVKKKWAIPGESLSMDEFKKGIADAEDGPFFTIEESKKMIEQWRVQKNSR